LDITFIVWCGSYEPQKYGVFHSNYIITKHLSLLTCALSKLHKNPIKVQWLESSQGRKKKGKPKKGIKMNNPQENKKES